MCPLSINHMSGALGEKSPEISEEKVVKKSRATKADAKKVGSANNYADDTPKPPNSADRVS